MSSPSVRVTTASLARIYPLVTLVQPSSVHVRHSRMFSTSHRQESDSIGTIEVQDDMYWGAQTERSRLNFIVGKEKVPIEVVHALAVIKQAAAIVNCEKGLLDEKKKEAIVAASKHVQSGALDKHFPLVVWQTGSGTQSNMNVNEVISNYAIEQLGGKKGSKDPIHPNDDVNKSQSSNDTFPSAIHVAACIKINELLLPNIQSLKSALSAKAEAFKDIVKIGRTHLMDATPLTLGQEFSGYVTQLENASKAIQYQLSHLSELAIGGTAVGTGLNTPPGYSEAMAKTISQITGQKFQSAPNKFEALAAEDAIVGMSGALKQLACSYVKIANDIRWMGSGPRSGLGELILPSNEPGSSIMPGKVNPTQCESMTMVAAQVIGNDACLGFAGSQGNFELNVYRPVMAHNLLQSIQLLGDSALSFKDKLVDGLEANNDQITKHVNNSLMLVTALNTAIGYENAASIAKKAYKENITLKEACLALKLLDEKTFDEAVDPRKMI